MKKQRFIVAALLTAALSAAAAFPGLASSNVGAAIQQIDEPLDVESSSGGQSERAVEDAPEAEADISLTIVSESTVPEEDVTEAAASATAASGKSDTETTAPAAASSTPAASASGAQDSPAQEAETADTPSGQEADLDASQRQIIQELIPDDIYRFYTSKLWDSVPETSVAISSLSAQDLVNEVYGVLRNAGRNSAIFTPVSHAVVEGYSIWFDKDDALSKIAGLYGRSISESAIARYNNEWGGDMPDMIAIDGDAIAPLNAEGEGRVSPSIDSAVLEGDELKVSLSFTATFDDAKDNGSGRATAVFTEDPQSILGYRLKSISLD